MGFRLQAQKGMLEDPKGFFSNLSNIGTFRLEDYEVVANAKTDLDYLMRMVSEGYRFHVD